MNIFILILLAGFIAYLGDVLGTKIGKKRLSLMGLRPRNTALVITIATGMLITILTLGFLAVISEDARTALFRIRAIRTEIDTLNKEIRTLKEERDMIIKAKNDLEKANAELVRAKASLEGEISELEKIVQIKRTGQLIFLPNQLLGYTVMRWDDSESVIVEKLEKLFEEVSTFATKSGARVRPLKNILEDSKTPVIQEVRELATGEELVVYLLTTQTVMADESLGDVKILARLKRKILSAGDYVPLPRFVIDASRDRSEIKSELSIVFGVAANELMERGMIIYPFVSFSTLDFHDLINELKSYNEPVEIRMKVLEDVTTIGPFKFKVEIIRLSKQQIDEFRKTTESVRLESGQEHR